MHGSATSQARTLATVVQGVADGRASGTRTRSPQFFTAACAASQLGSALLRHAPLSTRTPHGCTVVHRCCSTHSLVSGGKAVDRKAGYLPAAEQPVVQQARLSLRLPYCTYQTTDDGLCMHACNSLPAPYLQSSSSLGAARGPLGGGYACMLTS